MSKDFPELIPHIEEYVQVYRPRYPHASQSPWVFLTQFGGPYTYQQLWGELRDQVYVRTQKPFYPHLIRTIWATEMLERGVNIDTVAYMLNDDPITVLKEYHELFGERHAEKVGQVLRGILTASQTEASPREMAKPLTIPRTTRPRVIQPRGVSAAPKTPARRTRKTPPRVPAQSDQLSLFVMP